MLLKAALPSIPGVNQLPGVKKAPVAGFSGLTRTRPPVTVERAHVDAYARVCGFPRKDVVPLSYPHMLVFEQQMAIMSDTGLPGAPRSARCTSRTRSPSTARSRSARRLDVVAKVGPALAHAKGTVYEFTTEVTSDGELVWEETSAYLRRGRGEEGASYGTVFPEAPTSGVEWQLPADLGRRYAARLGRRQPDPPLP